MKTDRTIRIPRLIALAILLVAASPLFAQQSPTYTRLHHERELELVKMNNPKYRWGAKVQYPNEIVVRQPKILYRFALGEVDLSDWELHQIRAVQQRDNRAARPARAAIAMAKKSHTAIYQLGEQTGVERFPVNPEDEASAIVAARDFVKQNLLSPRTAKFSGAWFPKERVWQMGPDRVKVFGWVDAQNVFGATLRNDYTCILRKIAEGVSPIEKWILEDIDIVPASGG